MIIYLYIVKCGRLCMGSPVLRMEVFFMGMQLSKDEAGKMLAELKKVNTIARIVNPVTERVLDSGLFTETDTICHNVWGKCERCENCSSLRAYRDHASAYKMEICKGQVYWIISRYLEIEDKPCILEMVNNVDGNFILDSTLNDDLAELIRKANREAIIDSRTGLYNRRFLDDDFVPSLSCCSKGVVNIAMMDVDNFKKINDDLGHLEGDMLLREIAGYWRGRFDRRESGKDRIVVRYGGDEILIITRGEEPEAFAREVKMYYDVMRKQCFCSSSGYFPFSISFGIASSAELPEKWTWEELFALADRRMYEVKNKNNQ